jgi:hypothetical protein
MSMVENDPVIIAEPSVVSLIGLRRGSKTCWNAQGIRNIPDGFPWPAFAALLAITTNTLVEAGAAVVGGNSP